MEMSGRPQRDGICVVMHSSPARLPRWSGHIATYWDSTKNTIAAPTVWKGFEECGCNVLPGVPVHAAPVTTVSGSAGPTRGKKIRRGKP